MLSPDPLQAAARQLERDRQATSAFPALFARKLAKMGGSPLAYLRGSAERPAASSRFIGACTSTTSQPADFWPSSHWL